MVIKMSKLEHIVKTSYGRRELIKFMSGNDWYKNNNVESNFQQNNTPYSITKRMIDKVDDIKNKSILIMFNLEFLETLIYIYGVDAKNITFIADTEVEKNMAECVYKVNTLFLTKDNHNVQGIVAIMAKKTFDLIMSNPPYNRNIDIKILNEVVDLADELVIVHPSTWAIDLKGKSKLYND